MQQISCVLICSLKCIQTAYSIYTSSIKLVTQRWIIAFATDSNLILSNFCGCCMGKHGMKHNVLVVCPQEHEVLVAIVETKAVRGDSAFEYFNDG